MKRFRYRFEAARMEARRATDAAARAFVAARSSARVAGDALAGSRGERARTDAAFDDRRAGTLALLDRDRWSVAYVASEAARVAAFVSARGCEARALNAYVVARRRLEAFDRHRARLLRAFASDLALREAGELDEANAPLRAGMRP